MSPPRADLHLHTHYSDGTFTPEEVVRRARSAGLAAIALTDHDTLTGLEPARRAAASATGHGGPATICGGGSDLEILSGVELTAVFGERELHVLGYGFRPDDAPLQEYLERAQDGRRGRIQAMIDRLREQGVDVSLEEVEAAAGDGDSIGRPHLAEVLVRKKIVRSLPEAFERFIGDRAPCFVHKATLTIESASQLIRAAGGVAVLAHPYRLIEESWIPELVRQGIQGLEVYHPDHTPSVSKHYRQLAEERGLLITGGSDCHGLRKAGGPTLGTVSVPYERVERLKDVLASEAKQSRS